mgnify:CR=1 FL=1
MNALRRRNHLCSTCNMLLAFGLCFIAQGNQQHQRGWAQWEGLFSSQDGIQQLFAQDFSPPDEFFVRDSDLVWVVLYCSPSARPCGSRDGSGVPDTYRQLASMLRDDRRVRGLRQGHHPLLDALHAARRLGATRMAIDPPPLARAAAAHTAPRLKQTAQQHIATAQACTSAQAPPNSRHLETAAVGQ